MRLLNNKDWDSVFDLTYYKLFEMSSKHKWSKQWKVFAMSVISNKTKRNY